MADRPRNDDEERRLSPAELEEFAEVLKTKRDKILNTARDARAVNAEGPIRMSDEVDLASAEYEAAFEYRLRDREKFLCKKIDKVLRRMEIGEYDICEECDSPIGKNRLTARPETTLCIECKEEQEKEEKMYEKKRPYRVNFEF